MKLVRGGAASHEEEPIKCEDGSVSRMFILLHWPQQREAVCRAPIRTNILTSAYLREERVLFMYRHEGVERMRMTSSPLGC